MTPHQQGGWSPDEVRKVISEVQEEFDAFDALPTAVKRAIQAAAFEISAIDVTRIMRAQRWTPEQAAAAVKQSSSTYWARMMKEFGRE